MSEEFMNIAAKEIYDSWYLSYIYGHMDEFSSFGEALAFMKASVAGLIYNGPHLMTSQRRFRQQLLTLFDYEWMTQNLLERYPIMKGYHAD